MKFCPSCNKQFPDNSKFCQECGEGLRSEQSRQGSGRTDQADLIGRVFFGEYTIVERLGEGGMGAVYLAEQNSIDQKIALKVLHAETAESDEIIQRFHREAKVISLLTHPNIVRVFIFGRTEDDLLFLAMEYVEGVELRDKLDGTPIDELMAIKVMKQICSAVAEAHDLGIIHRDLKPENILLTQWRGDENYVKILDFGIAKIKHPDGQQGPQLTQAGIVYGTPEYLSPEQAQAHELDNRTDIYALGCILFEMLTGRVPFEAKSSVEILKKKVFEDPPRPTEYGPVAPTMEEIIMTAMEPDRDDRFDSALQMFDALDRREKELEQERQLDRRDTYFPGSELSGVRRAIGNEETAPSESGEIVAETGAGGAGMDDKFETAATVSMDAPPEEKIKERVPDGMAFGQENQNHQGGASANNPGAQQSANPRQPNRGRQQQAHQQAPQQQRAAQSQQLQQRQQAGNPSPSDASRSAPLQARGQGQPQRAQAPNHQTSTTPQQGNPQKSNQNQFVRYLLIGAVIILSLAVAGLGVYLAVIMFGG